MKVLAIGCHPDDIEFLCAGTLLKYKKEGHEVYICHVANGNMGHMEINPPALRELRLNEAKNSGLVAGIEVLTCDIDDLTLDSSDMNQVLEVVKIIRKVNPDVIITHSPNDYMKDHNEVSKMVFDASFKASVPHFAQHLKGKSSLTPIYYMDTISGFDFQPTEYVDISEFMDRKIQMLEEHKSQVKWIREYNNVNIAEKVKALARFRGMQCGVEFAEGFRPCFKDLRMRPFRVLP